MPPCLHEMADTRMDMDDNGYKKLRIRTVDSDVLVIMIGLFHAVKGKVDNIWVEYGVGKTRAYHNIEVIIYGSLRQRVYFSFTHYQVAIQPQAFETKGKSLEHMEWFA